MIFQSHTYIYNNKLSLPFLEPLLTLFNIRNLLDTLLNQNIDPNYLLNLILTQKLNCYIYIYIKLFTTKKSFIVKNLRRARTKGSKKNSQIYSQFQLHYYLNLNFQPLHDISQRNTPVRRVVPHVPNLPYSKFCSPQLRPLASPVHRTATPFYN